MAVVRRTSLADNNVITLNISDSSAPLDNPEEQDEGAHPGPAADGNGAGGDGSAAGQ